jgi:hypothetical protein
MFLSPGARKTNFTPGSHGPGAEPLRAPLCHPLSHRRNFPRPAKVIQLCLSTQKEFVKCTATYAQDSSLLPLHH